MTYIRTVPPEEASGTLREMYDQDVAGSGYIANYTRAMSLRPEVIAAWSNLSKAIRSNMDLAALRASHDRLSGGPQVQLLNAGSRGGAPFQALHLGAGRVYRQKLPQRWVGAC